MAIEMVNIFIVTSYKMVSYLFACYIYFIFYIKETILNKYSKKN